MPARKSLLDLLKEEDFSSDKNQKNLSEFVAEKAGHPGGSRRALGRPEHLESAHRKPGAHHHAVLDVLPACQGALENAKGRN